MLEKFKNAKNLPVILLICCAAMMLYFMSSGDAVSITGEEEHLAKVLSMIEGAGKVSVYIPNDDDTAAAFSYSASDTEKNKKGIIIIAQGARDPMVRIKLTKAASVALGVDESCVCVYAGDE